MKLAFILDPLEGLKAYKDSSVAMMRCAAKRGHEVWAIQRAALTWRDGVVAARAQRLKVGADKAPALQGGRAKDALLAVADDDTAWYAVAEEAVLPLTAWDAVLMRQDPPFDFEYVAATWLLERAESQGARIWNKPRAIRDHSEKVAITEFPQYTPTTLIARDPDDIHAFIDELGDVILKPLDGMGGSSIFRVLKNDPNRNVIVETLTNFGARSIMAQRYLPAITHGDKRILLIAGEPVPYCLARIPKPGESRGNLAAGGKGVARPLLGRDREIAEALAPTLWARGLLIVGLDVIGDCLTEINVTSPTCFVEIAQQMKFDVAALAIDALERECRTSAAS
ncbi:glutathione synthase [Sulfuritalea hydrogenivorans]|jgi:glutathione synthase|uniref:Glutathione synthetase n=1 Tax=Sulfuritalea hydrogenivorans sk43H TaxID=1223802 RepID=W0SKM3_9PROT|nr:glutathione synthase [Sulfuritalea hydrogenivorans]BAO31285.1 glutathione synthetase [Sulfuritalea hydrogenivorans sk43H]